MPANYVHKHSVLFAVLGRPAGPEKEHDLLGMNTSGPTEEPGGGG